MVKCLSTPGLNGQRKATFSRRYCLLFANKDGPMMRLEREQPGRVMGDQVACHTAEASGDKPHTHTFIA